MRKLKQFVPGKSGFMALSPEERLAANRRGQKAAAEARAKRDPDFMKRISQLGVVAKYGDRLKDKNVRCLGMSRKNGPCILMRGHSGECD
jgi:hypothetical protein